MNIESAISLWIVFVVAKLAAMSALSPAPSSRMLVACVWQDALVALAFEAVRMCVPARISRTVYWALVSYTAMNVPVARVLGTPLTWPMLGAARGPLADSILMYATAGNLQAASSVFAAAAAVPRLLRHAPGGFRAAAIGGTAATIIVGAAAGAHLDVHGFDRNVLVVLVTSGLPRVEARAASREWRRSPFDAGPSEDLSSLRALAEGRNVIFVSLESTAAAQLPMYGGRDEVTPRLTALARDAVVADNAYAAYPESIKGLYSILCSTFPAFDTAAEDLAAEPCISLPARLRTAGYRTALFHSGRFDYLGMRAVIDRRGYETTEDAGDIGGVRESSFGVDEPSTVARMLRWIDAVPPGSRFFLTYLPIAGHHPYESAATVTRCTMGTLRWAC